RRFEQVGRGIGIEGGELAFFEQGGEARAGFDGELVEREMLGAEAYRAGQLGLPLRLGLIWPGIDQVEAHATEMALRGVERTETLGNAMRTAEEAQCIVVERLEAERYAVDPCGSQIGKARRLDRRGIGLERDFHAGLEIP